MIKIGLCVRNRLAVTKKVIEALHKHTKNPFQLYVYDNITNYKLQEHFDYFSKLFREGMISQVTFNTKASTHEAFSKAAALNQFGQNHEQDPKKDKTDFLLFLDNDMLVTPDWDEVIKKAWRDVKRHRMENVKVISQHPSAIKFGSIISTRIAGYKAYLGKLGGSAFWTVRPNFFRDVGYLDLGPLVGLCKKHDQNYWVKMDRLTKGQPYILGVKKVLALNSGKYVGSICNVIGFGSDAKRMEKIKYANSDRKVESMTFDEFYNMVKGDKRIDKNPVITEEEKSENIHTQKTKYAILAGPFLGEFGWELLRFAPHVLWYKKHKHKGAKLIVYTREDRFDLYGKYADELIPLEISGDFQKYTSDCLKLTGFPDQKYKQLVHNFRAKYSAEYTILEHIVPRIGARRYTEKGQFPDAQKIFNFKPRPQNKTFVDKMIPSDKPVIVLGPRFRRHNKKRNWNNWKEFYDLIENLRNRYSFVLCGRAPEYIPDPKDRYYDINKFQLPANTSLVGVTIEVLRRAILCIGSQSGIPNLSNLIGTPTLQWGNEKKPHTVTYNVKNTPTTFLDDPKFNIKPDRVVLEMNRILKKMKRRR